ncbi:hypothetical protein [Bacillus alkalicellulosilyticus]|uniref:hypothetical protein n=1 Tax=Alkalihalobacterium alkalicellulosilyticum TaxID=1912214 RepID=UPI00099817A9|nr:hypothetical protein [Bacillus alkalicellulosilyticus]
MISRLFSFVLMISGYFAFKYRYRILNNLLSQQTIRRLLIRSSMRMPFVRRQILNNFVFTDRR